jgi:hypothetical protein
MNKVKTVSVYMKHNDMTGMQLYDADGNTIEEMDSDYFPHVGVFGGDDTELTIDNETGKIIGWVPITTLSKDD